MNLAERFQPKDKSVLKPVLIGAGALTGLAAIAAAAMLAKKRKIEPGKKKVDVEMTPPEKKPKKPESTPLKDGSAPNTNKDGSKPQTKNDEGTISDSKKS